MTIPEAIKFIVNRKDDSLLKDSKKFNAYLKDLCSDNPKELKIVNRILEDKILARIFGNDRDNVKIARLRDEFEDQGLSTDWSEFIISSFAQVLGWNYEPKETKNIEEQKIIYIEKPVYATRYITETIIEIALNKAILERLGYEFYDNGGDGECIDIIKNGNEITSINIPETFEDNGKIYKITSINGFSGCSSLKNINIPESITSIGNYAFWGCRALQNINIPEGVTNIGDSAFEFCDSLQNIILPDSITSIGDNAFLFCDSLESINIPEGVTNIGDAAFSGCSSLKNINIPYGITRIGWATFAGCSSLKSITIPDSVTEIAFSVTTGYDAFAGVDTIYYNGSASGSPWGARHHRRY